MSDLEGDLRFLVGKYGYSSVYNKLQSFMKNEYAFLQFVFRTSDKVQKSEIQPATHPGPQGKQPQEEASQPPFTQTLTNESASAPKLSKNTTISVKKEGSSDSEKKGKGRPKQAGKEKKEKKLIETSAPIENEIIKEVIVNTEDIKEVEVKQYRDPKEVKKWQREQEQAKRAELDAQGITVESLLTKENLKKWIEGEGRTYSDVARTYVGCPDSQVSAAAKAYGIQSAITGKRAAVIYR